MKKICLILFAWVTSAYATPNRITDLVVVSASTSKIVLTCTVPKMQVGILNKLAPVEPVSQIELRMDITSGRLTSTKFDECKIVGIAKDPGPAGTKVTFTIEDLEPNTKYYFVCRAMDSKWGPTSNLASGSTLREDKIIRVKWTYKNDGGSTPDVVLVFHGPTRAMVEKPIAVRGDVFSADITGLKWGVPYYWQVVTVNSVGEVKESPVRSDSK